MTNSSVDRARAAAGVVAAAIIVVAASTYAARGPSTPRAGSPSTAATPSAPSPSPSPSATPIPDRKILFRVNLASEEGARLESIDASGEGRRYLLSGGHEATWSPDGTSVAYESDGIVVESLGKDRRRVTNESGDTDPEWSPNGRWIAFTRMTLPRGVFAIFIVRPDGTELRQITDPGEATRDTFHGDIPTWGDHAPDWSPDSKSIVFTRIDTGDVEPGIWIQRIGGNARSIGSRFKFNGAEPAWSPDGRRIALTYRSEIDNTSFNIAVYDLQTKKLNVLTSQRRWDEVRDNAPPRRHQPRNQDARWSPDGREIAFESNRDHEYDHHDSRDIYVMRADGTDVRRVTSHPPPMSPALMPDYYYLHDW